MLPSSEEYSYVRQLSGVNYILSKSLILDVWQGSEDASDHH